MCLDNRSLSCSWTCLQEPEPHLVVSNQQEPLQHLEVSIPPEAELHLNVSGQQESVLLLYECTAHRPELHLELSWQPKTLLLLDMSTWCCYITVDSATTALQNGACTYRCISKQMHYKTPVSHMKSLEIHENYITLFCLERNKLFCNITLTQNHAWYIITQWLE